MVVSEMEDVTKATSCQRAFLWKQATEFLEGLENRQLPSVVIPQCLSHTPTVNDDDKGPVTKKHKAFNQLKKGKNLAPQVISKL